MKKFSLILCFVFAMFFLQFHTVGAVNNQLSQEKLDMLLKIVAGDWYDHDGNMVISIHDGYLNGCSVAAGFDWAGSRASGCAIFRILEGTGLRDLRISWWRGGGGAGHFVQIDKGEHLHITPNEYFFESVAGIHLGMTTDEVEAKYGKAQRIAEGQDFFDGKPNRIRCYYPNMGVVLWLDGKSIVRISLLKDSPLHFERSGLNCWNAPEEYAKAYSMDRIPSLPKKKDDGRAYGIGHGEFLYFGPDMSYVGLDIYPY